jgi:alpha-acetolactate decarboxylase
MKDFNLLLFSRETFIKFQEIQGISSQRQQEIIKLYLENSEITAKLSKSQGMLSETSTKLSNALEKIVYYEKELNSAISNYQSHVENIEKAIQLESKFTSIKEKDTFKDIQVSQDQVISRLQQESELSSLTLQQISAEIVELDGKIKIFNSKASRLERELLSKGLDLMKSENKFEDFRVKVEENTKFDLSRLKNMES